MEKPNYYSIIPANVRYDKDLMANAKLLYGEITALCNDNGVCWAGNEYFANLYEVSKETISRWISQLKKKGYIYIKIFYKSETKEIDKRIISLVKFDNQYPIDENVNTYCQNNQSNILLTKTSIPYLQNNQEGIDKNVKENITSINNKKEEEGDFKKIINFYEDNITLITPFVSEDIQRYLQEGLDSNLIIDCMKEAVSRNKRNWHYIVSILNDCCNNNIKTSKQFNIKQREFKFNNNCSKQFNKKEKVKYDEVEYTDEEEYKQKILGKG